MVCIRKNCRYCGRFFKPHRRVGSRQKCCGRPECITKRNREAQKKYRTENPDYFKNRYEYLLSWRGKNPDYQRQWRAKRSEIQNVVSNVTTLKSIRFIRPVVLAKNEIKDLVVHVTIYYPNSYNDMDGVGEIKDMIGISP